jgi:hypothetical protein
MIMFKDTKQFVYIFYNITYLVVTYKINDLPIFDISINLNFRYIESTSKFLHVPDQVSVYLLQ